MPSSNEEAQSNDEVFREIEDYFGEAKKGGDPVQVGDPPQYVLSPHARLRASSSGGASPSTSGMLPAGAGAQYACEDWVSRLSAKKMGQISREYRLGYLLHWVAGDERPHLPPPSYMAI